MSRTISVFEHNKVLLTGDDPPLQERHLRQLERLNRQAGVDLVKLGYRQIQATSYVGVIQLNNLAIQILPKVDQFKKNDANNRQSIQSATTNLLWMLWYAQDLPVREQQLSHLLTQSHQSLFEFLVFLFCEQLQTQVERGLHRTYLRHRDLLPVLKGRWKLTEHQLRYPLIRDKFLVEYDDFTPDIQLNRILAYTVHWLRRFSQDAQNRRRLEMLAMWFEEVTIPAQITRQDLERVVFTRLNSHWQPVFTLAKMFLLRDVVQFQSGNAETFAFLFDMNELFEKFVAGFLRRHKATAIPANYQDCQIVVQAGSLRRALGRNKATNHSVFPLKPDLLLRRQNGDNPLIIDTKYKTSSTISTTDAYQMTAYALRYESEDVLLLYPEGQMTDETIIIPPYPSSGSFQTRLHTRTINLHRDLNQKTQRNKLAQDITSLLKGLQDDR